MVACASGVGATVMPREGAESSEPQAATAKSNAAAANAVIKNPRFFNRINSFLFNGLLGENFFMEFGTLLQNR